MQGAVRIAMSLIVRDEIDLIAENIRFHAAQGVDSFIVMDNASRDGTRERVGELAKDFDIEIVDQQATDFRKGLWSTELACRMRETGNADYIISNDADEFWLSKQGNIKEALAKREPVLAVRRTNMLPLADDLNRPDFKFYDAILNVVRPLGRQQACIDPLVPLNFPMLLREFPPKIICQLEGLQFIRHGNHDVEHKGGSPTVSHNLHIYHFPLKRYAQFVKKIEFARERFAHEQNPQPGISWHLRRWVAQMDLGTFAEEYASYPIEREAAADLEARGIIERDESIRRFFVRRYGQLV